MSSLGDLMVRVGCEIDGFSSAMRDVVSQASDAADSVADKLESVGDVGRKLAVLGASLTTAITLPLEEIARRSIDVAGTFEQTRIAFQSLMGSSAAADAKLKELYDFAARTPFEIPQVLDGARKLMALGFAASDIVPILRVVGDQAAALGMGGVGMDRILMNLGKIEAQGKITGHELRNLGEDDVPALASIALARHESKPEAFKDVSAGKVDSEEAINAILRGMQLRTGGLMESQMQSFQAQMSNLKDQITLTAAAIGNALLPVGKVLVGWAQEAIAGVKELAVWFQQLPAPIQGAAIALAALAAAAGPVLTAIGGLGFLLPNIVGGLAAIATFFSQIGVAVAGIGAAVTGVVEYITTLGAMAVEYGVAATASFAFSDSLLAVGATLLGWPALIVVAIGALAALATWVYTHWAGVKAFLSQVFDGLGEAWHASLGVVVEVIHDMMGGAASDLIGIWTTFKGAFLEIWDAIGSFLHRTIDGFKSDIQDLIKLLEKIPGMQKVFSAGDAFTKADHDSSERSEMTGIGKQLRVGADNTPFHLTDAYQAALEKHNTKLKEAVELLAKFKKGYEDGIVSEKDFKQAEANVEFIRQDVPKREKKSTADGKTKLDRNALDGISGEHAHEEAQVALQRAQIEHAYAMAKPGSADTLGISPEEQAQQEIAAAEKRKAALDKLADDERKKTLENIADKLKVYGGDEDAHKKLIAAKTAAEDKYAGVVQKTTFDLETIKKQSNERVLQDDITNFNKDLAAMVEAQTRMAEAQKKHARDLASMSEETLKAQRQNAEATISMEEKQARFKLDTGEITKNAYLKIKQDEADRLHDIEMQEIADAQKTLDMEYEMALLAVPPDRPDLIVGVNDEFQKRQIKLDSNKQQVDDRHNAKTQDIGLEKQKDQYTTIFAPVQSGFASAISNMIKGTQTFRQAWMSMSTGILGSWINSISQMASKWVTHLAQMAAQWVLHKLGIVAVHAAANQAQVASTAAAATETNAITTASHMKEVFMEAKLAAVKAWRATVGIPIVGPILAPIAAAATFAGVMAFGAISAESGAVLPDHNTVGFLHPQEMVLPRPISVGLQNLIASGGLSNAGSIMNQTQGGSMSSTALQALRNTAAADTGDTHHNYHGPMHYHASPGESMTVDTFGKMFKTYVRQNNFKMP